MPNIEEFRASLTAKRDLAGRMAAAAGATDIKHYHRGRVHAFEQARKMLADVDEDLRTNLRELHRMGTWQGEGRITGVNHHFAPGPTYEGCLECETSGPCSTLLLLEPPKPVNLETVDLVKYWGTTVGYVDYP